MSLLKSLLPESNNNIITRRQKNNKSLPTQLTHTGVMCMEILNHVTPYSRVSNKRGAPIIYNLEIFLAGH